MRAALVAVATIGTIAFNAFAAAGLVNGVTPAAISDKYLTVLTPAGYAFSIWTLIYLGMAAFSFYQILGTNLTRFRSVRTPYISSCVLNCGWIYFWHHDQIGVCLVLIFLLLAALVLILFLLGRAEAKGGLLFTRVPFGIYAGWVTAATLVNLMIFLKYLGVEFSSSLWSALGVILIIIAAAAAVLVRWKLKNFLYPLAIAWAITAIAIKQGTNTAIVVASAVVVVVCLITAGSVVVELRDSTSE